MKCPETAVRTCSYEKVFCKYAEITLIVTIRHGFSPGNLHHICRTSFHKNTDDRCQKKPKDSLESSLDQVLFAAELEFSKILVPRLPQSTSNVNTDVNTFTNVNTFN